MKQGSATLYVRSYDLLVWLIPWVDRLPRDRQRRHGEEILDAARALLLAISLALKLPGERSSQLLAADVALERLRLALRVAGALQVLSGRHRRFLMPQVEELGRMLGGWQRYERRQRRRFEWAEGPEGDASG